MDADKIREIRLIRENPRFRRYPEYKETGMKWVGEIPEHWRVERAKFIFRRLQRPVRENDEIITAFRDGIVTLRKNRRTLGFTNSLKEIGYQGLRRGDLVIHAMDGHAGAIGVSDSDGKSSPVYSVCCPISEDNVYYYAYLLRYMALSGFIESLARGVRERSTEFRFNEFKELELPIPTVSEQIQITNFLDRKTEQIDELIRIKERRIELLQEQRTALINQAVTKGLDPNAEMEPSDVEWIGEIPKYWKIKRLKYIVDLNMGQSPPSEEYNSDQIGTPFLQGNAEFGLHHPIPKIYCPTARKHANPGDILLSVRAPVGSINIADQEYGIGRGLCAIRPRINQFEHHYAKYLLEVVRAELYAVATGTTYEAVTVDEVSNITCVVPPLSEQARIADLLDRKTQQIDDLIATEQRKIERLKEYRQSLISEAVTGKIDVRNVQIV